MDKIFPSQDYNRFSSLENFHEIPPGVDLVENLIQKPKTTSEKRRENNAQIRLILPNLSVFAVAYLAITIRHDLSRRELWNRLKENSITDIYELFYIYLTAFDGYHYSPDIIKLWRHCCTLIINNHYSYSAENIAQILYIVHSKGSRVFRDSNIFEDILRDRPDKQKIVELVASKNPKFIKVRAYLLWRIGYLLDQPI